MKYVRIYADEPGASHFEDVEVPITGVEVTNAGAIASEVADLMPATGIFFREAPADYLSGWHTAPRPQFVFNLSGQFEVEASDGEVRRFGPGDVLLADDLTGQGHITRAAGGAGRVTAYIPLKR